MGRRTLDPRSKFRITEDAEQALRFDNYETTAALTSFDNSAARLPDDPGTVQAAVTGAAAIPMAKAPPEMAWVDDDEISIAAGRCRDEDDETNIVLPDPITIDDISIGGPAHRHVLVGLDGNVDPAATLSETIALPSGWQAFRRIGSIRTNESGGIFKFRQNGDRFLVDVGEVLEQTSGFSEFPTWATLTLPIPTGVRVMPRMVWRLNVETTGQRIVFVSDFEETFSNTDMVVGATSPSSSETQVFGRVIDVDADEQGRVKWSTTTSSGITRVRCMLAGWTDRRGRDK